MSEPALDLSEIVQLYKEDARRMVGEMRAALEKWEEIQKGGPARQALRRLSHQLRGSGRTYGFRQVTRLGKAIESVVVRLEKGTLPADERVHEFVSLMVEKMAAAFAPAA